LKGRAKCQVLNWISSDDHFGQHNYVGTLGSSGSYGLETFGTIANQVTDDWVKLR
jgi:hypothetical protein